MIEETGEKSYFLKFQYLNILTRTCPPYGLICVPLGIILAPLRTPWTISWPLGILLGPPWDPLGASLGSSWVTCGPLRLILEAFGGLLDPLGATLRHLGAFWSHLALILLHFGAIEHQFRTMLGSSGAIVYSKLSRLYQS